MRTGCALHACRHKCVKHYHKCDHTYTIYNYILTYEVMKMTPVKFPPLTPWTRHPSPWCAMRFSQNGSHSRLMSGPLVPWWSSYLLGHGDHTHRERCVSENSSHCSWVQRLFMVSSHTMPASTVCSMCIGHQEEPPSATACMHTPEGMGHTHSQCGLRPTAWVSPWWYVLGSSPGYTHTWIWSMVQCSASLSTGTAYGWWYHPRCLICTWRRPSWSKRRTLQLLHLSCYVNAHPHYCWTISSVCMLYVHSWSISLRWPLSCCLTACSLQPQLIKDLKG